MRVRLMRLIVWSLQAFAWSTLVGAAPMSSTGALPASTHGAEVYSGWPFDAAEAARRQHETAARLGLPVEWKLELPAAGPLLFVLIPAGAFAMGSPESEPLRRNEPLHKVRITKPFYLAKYVCTQAQWQALLGDNPSLFKNKPDSDRRPVEHVSFKRITDEFLPRLQTLAPQGWTFRLPTEAEWEYACRAGTETPFSFGRKISPDAANYDDTRANEGGHGTRKRGEALAVGSFAPNPWGLFDMHGNVFQWCQDWHVDGYRQSPADDPCNATAGSGRILRGGCWIHGPSYCRSASRYFAPPDYLAGSIGFRVALACQ